MEETLRRLKMDGFCVIGGIIPDDKIAEVRNSIVAAQAAHHEKSEAEKAKTRARGHRIGAKGVGSLKQIINVTQRYCQVKWNSRVLEAKSVVGRT